MGNSQHLGAISKKTPIGRQLVDAGDSIAANIAEGYGRFYFKDRKLFYYYSRGSLLETKSWVTKAELRRLIGQAEAAMLYQCLSELHYKLNSYIKSLGPLSNQP